VRDTPATVAFTLIIVFSTMVFDGYHLTNPI